MPSRSQFGSAADREEFPRLRSDIGEDDPLYHPKLGALFRKNHTPRLFLIARSRYVQIPTRGQ